MFEKIKHLGEEHVTRIATQLVSNESFVHAVQVVVARTLRTREQIEAAVQRVLASLDVPTAEDVETILDRISDLEERMDEVIYRIEAVESAPKPGPKRRASGKTTKKTR